MSALALTRRRLLVVMGIVLAVAAIARLLWESRARPAGESSSIAAARDARPPPELEARPASPREAEADSPPPDEEGSPSEAATPPSPKPANAPPPATPTSLRLELRSPSGIGEPIAISKVYYRGNEYLGSALPDGRLAVWPGTNINLLTSDPRAAFDGVYLRIPDPVPAVLTAQIPLADDPRLSSLVVEVVDAKTSAPIAGAELLFEDDRRPSLRSDAQGRIALDRKSLGDSKAALLVAWSRAPASLHAKGYRSESRRIGVWDVSKKNVIPEVLPASLITDWLDRGVVRIALSPLDEGWREWEFLLTDASGAPAPRVLVVSSAAWPAALGAAVTPRDASPGAARRTDENGRVSFPMPIEARVLGLDVFRDRNPIAAFLLDLTQQPSAGPREIRLPALAEVELVLEGVPPDIEITGYGDWLGAARMARDGPAFPVEMDPGARQLVTDRHLVFITGSREVLVGSLPSADTTRSIRFAMPVRTTKTLWINNRSGSVSIEATAPGPLRVVKRWDDVVR